jgi:hypothetical protein
MKSSEPDVGISRFERAIQEVWPRPEFASAVEANDRANALAICGGAPEPSPPFTQPNLEHMRLAIRGLRGLLADGMVRFRRYPAGWVRIIWQRGSRTDLAAYQECCEQLPGGWEPEKAQVKPVDGVTQLVERSSYAALLDPKLFDAGQDTSFIDEFTKDCARARSNCPPRQARQPLK